MNAAAAKQTADPKAWATLQARSAIAGYQLYRTAEQDGSLVYFAARWGMVRALADLEEVERFLKQVGA
jgi:hypothetical protein